MLIITRGTGKGFEISVPPSQEETTIRVVMLENHRSHQSRVGIEAPTTVRILRDELVGKPDKKSQ